MNWNASCNFRVDIMHVIHEIGVQRRERGSPNNLQLPVLVTKHIDQSMGNPHTLEDV